MISGCESGLLASAVQRNTSWDDRIFRKDEIERDEKVSYDVIRQWVRKALEKKPKWTELFITVWRKMKLDASIAPNWLKKAEKKLHEWKAQHYSGQSFPSSAWHYKFRLPNKLPKRSLGSWSSSFSFHPFSIHPIPDGLTQSEYSFRRSSKALTKLRHSPDSFKRYLIQHRTE